MAAAVCDPLYVAPVCPNSLFSQARLDMKLFEFMAAQFASSIYHPI